MREKSQATRKALMEAALKVISREGYHAATVDQIVKEAGVSKGLAYYHFKNKEAIANAILEDGAARMLARFQERVALAQTGSEALRSMAVEFASGVFENKAFGRFFLNELWQEHRALSQGMRAYEEQLLDIIQRQIERCQSEGSIRKDVNAEFEAVALVGLVFSSALYYLMDRGNRGREAMTAPASVPMTKEQFTESIVDFVRHANA